MVVVGLIILAILIVIGIVVIATIPQHIGIGFVGDDPDFQPPPINAQSSAIVCEDYPDCDKSEVPFTIRSVSQVIQQYNNLDLKIISVEGIYDFSITQSSVLCFDTGEGETVFVDGYNFEPNAGFFLTDINDPSKRLQIIGVDPTVEFAVKPDFKRKDIVFITGTLQIDTYKGTCNKNATFETAVLYYLDTFEGSKIAIDRSSFDDFVTQYTPFG